MELPYFLSHIKVTGPYFNKKQGRNFVTYKNLLSNKVTQKTYAKYLLEVYLQREISSEETVDHIDRNKLNDVLDNLRIVSKSDHSKQDSIRAKRIKFICPICSIEFTRSARQTRSKHKQESAGPFCSILCRGKYGKQVQVTKQKLPIQKHIDSEYFYLEKK